VPAPRSTLRSFAVVLATSGMAVAGLTVLASPAQALAAPSGLKNNIRNSSTAVLSWSAVAKATSYEVQVDNTAGYASPEFSAKTVNTKAVSTKSLVPGKNFWRVRSLSSDGNSKWVTGSFTVAPVTTPIPLAPADGAALAQPQSPPLLQWSSSQGAISYTVEVDADADLIGAKVYSTKTTSLVVPDPLTIGDWYWRVTAVKGTGLVSLPSSTSRFDIQPVALPQITYPANDVNQAIEDVVLDWTPVPGARTYDVQVALDSGFNNIALTITNVQSTRYSPPVTLNSDQFWWRVRAVDLAGQATPWAASQFGFLRQWPDKPQAVFPTGAVSSPTAVSTAKPFYQWTPVQHATTYELYTASDENMTVAVDKCTVVGTTYTPRRPDDCGFRSGSTTYWEVRPIDAPYPVSTGLPGIFSTVQAFTWTDPGISGVWNASNTATNLKIAIDGNGIANAGAGCTATLCDGVPTTPVLSWDPVPGAGSYRVYVAQDVNFTTTELPTIPVTNNTVLALRLADNTSTLPESQAGSAYFWYVQPCLGANGAAPCGASPVSQNPPLPGSKAFRKASPPVTGLTSTTPNASEITFSWQDYFDTNQATSWGAQLSNQSAKNYRIQVDNEPSFSTPIDTKVVDQTTYTEYDKLYADGTYFWRVQALDDEDYGLTWSAVQAFTKVSPPVTPYSPVSGALVAGTTPFRWSAEPFAASYTVEVYKNNDLSFSTANRVFTATVKTTAYAPASPIPASGTPYVWRVRRQDASNNPGPWSSPQAFFSTGVAPSLLAPKAGVWVKSANGYFEWTEVPGAASYAVTITSSAGASKVSTVATAYAPTSAFKTGKYTWNVTAYDGAGQPLATSATRAFKVDATAPFVTKVTPTTLKPTSTIKVKFSEKVKGISEKSIKLYRLKGEKQKKVLIKTKVKSLKKGKAASIDPKGRLKHGDYLLLFKTSRLKDKAGNRLVASDVTPALRVVPNAIGRTPDGTRDHRVPAGFNTAP
jgi:hypothetical protein